METHEQFTERLRGAMRDNYTAVHPARNPVAAALADLAPDALKYVLGQYTLFPKSIVALLMDARYGARVACWEKVAAELTKNIGEELGTETSGVPHYRMLVEGLAGEIEDPTVQGCLEDLIPLPATRQFIAQVAGITQSETVAYAVGGAYALESSAVPELVIVQDAVNELLKRTKERSMRKDGQLGDFFQRHLNTWEPGHEEGLREATGLYVAAGQDRAAFEQGFCGVMVAMDQWWAGLYNESKMM